MGSQSHPYRSNKGAILSSRPKRKGKKPGSEYHPNPGLSLPTCNHLPLSLSLLNPLLYLSSREDASWISGNITFLTAPPPGWGPTTEHVYLVWLALRDCHLGLLTVNDLIWIPNFVSWFLQRRWKILTIQQYVTPLDTQFPIYNTPLYTQYPICYCFAS